MNEINQVRSPVSINGAIKANDTAVNVVAEILSLLGSKGVTVETAQFILDKSKEAVEKCTLLQTEYTP